MELSSPILCLSRKRLYSKNLYCYLIKMQNKIKSPSFNVSCTMHHVIAGLTDVYMVKTSMTHYKYLTPQFLEYNNNISIKYAAQILSE